MSSAFKPIFIGDLRGGRNGVEAPTALRDDECAEALNVDWHGAPMGRKRGGSDADGMTFSSGGPFTGTISFLGRHVPSTDESAAELWAIDDAATPIVGRKAAAATYAAVTLKDAITGNAWDVVGATCNGLFFLAYKSAQNRQHVWDGSTVRRAGLAVPVAPSVANTGAGTYAATLRYYRVRWAVQSAGVTVRRSEPSSSTSFTPSGGGTAARVTQPAVANEGETHWEVEASLDNATFYRLSTVAIATTTYDDSAATSTYSANTVSAAVGTYTNQKPYRFIAADLGRLIGFGSYNPSDKQNDIEISGVIGSLNVGDVERVDTTSTYRYTLDENDSGVPTGLVGPVNGSFFAFKSRQVWKLTPTGNPANPYSVIAISKRVGAVNHKAIVVAEDELGNPAIYWMSQRGPYRYGRNGLEYLGRGVEDLIIRDAPNSISVMNLSATKVVAHAVYHSDKRQVWFWFATGSNNDPDTKIVLQIGDMDPVTGHTIPSGWARHTGPSANARCSVMFSRTIGATMSLDLKPYIGYAGATNIVYRTDSTTTDDAGAAFQSYLDTKVYLPGGLGKNCTIGRANLLAKAASGVTITQSVIPDFGKDTTRTSTVSLTPSASETYVQPKFEDAACAGASGVQFRYGDAAAVSNQWALIAAEIDVMPAENR